MGAWINWIYPESKSLKTTVISREKPIKSLKEIMIELGGGWAGWGLSEGYGQRWLLQAEMPFRFARESDGSEKREGGRALLIRCEGSSTSTLPL